MLSAMTTSENFLHNQTGCARSLYKSVIQPSCVATILRQNHPQFKAESSLIEDEDVDCGKMPPTICYLPSGKIVDVFQETEENEEKEEGGIYGSCGKDGNFLATEVPKSELENELTDFLEQLDLDDPICEQSKPLKIDPNVLKLDFSKLSIKGDYGTLGNLCLSDFSENKRASHHLSGGGLLTDASQDDFSRNPENESLKNRFCKLSGGGLVTTENVFNFEKLGDLDVCLGGVSSFLNQISPSSPLTFDLTGQQEQLKNASDGISSCGESTNPFKNFIKNVLESENSFSPTNPFSDFVCSSSLNEIPSIRSVPARNENVSVMPTNEKSFSQCSTRPASPVSKIPDESCVSNPFLVNETSPESHQTAVAQFFINESSFQNSATVLPNPSSFIFAVPVFPIFQNKITNSSTQTVDLSEVSKPDEADEPSEPVYQNVTHQLRKFLKNNDHSEYDLQCLKTTVKDLRNSGWYYENVSWQESMVLLKNTEPGTFLIRDSSDPNFLFSLSVQTCRGPTSVRIHYVNGQFRLDAEKKLIPHMPSFNSIIELIDYYVDNTVKNKGDRKCSKTNKNPGKHKLQKSKDQVWIDPQGNIYSNILLVKPLYKKDSFLSLQHLARLTINKRIKKGLNAKVKFNFRVTPVYESSPFQDSSFQNNFDNFCPILSINTLPLPSKLLEFLKEYPYCH